MAKKPAPAPEPQELDPETPEAFPEQEAVVIPQEVIDAMGGMPIPPPPIRAPRPTVTRVGEKLAKGRPDPGGLLATPRPERRDAVKKIDLARISLGNLVHNLEASLAVTGAKVGEAIKDPEACEAEGFDPVRASALIEDLNAVIERHFTEVSPS